MTELSVDDVFRMAEAVGIETDRDRAETIAARLSGVMAELDDLPEDLLASVEPAHTFSVERE